MRILFKNNFNSFNWEGKHHSEKTKKKMRESAKGKHVDEKNSQYGTCWVYNTKRK